MFFLSENCISAIFGKSEQLSDFRQYHRGGKRQVRTKPGYLKEINALSAQLSPENAGKH